jgi:hypothetical protein
MEPFIPPAATDEKDVIIDVHSAPKINASAGNMVPHGTVMMSRLTKTQGYNNPRGATPRKTKKQAQGQRRVIEARNGLPTLRANPTMGYIFRYVTTGDITAISGFTVKISDLARAMVVASASDAFRYLFRAVKLNRVTIRSAPGTIGGTASVGIQFRGENTNEVTIMDQSTRVDHNAMVSRTPPRLSLASFWHDVTNTTDDEKDLFAIYSNNDGDGTTYVDVHLSVVFDENRYINYTTQNGTLSGLATGGTYYGNLSTSGSASQQFTPVGRIALGL